MLIFHSWFRFFLSGMLILVFPFFMAAQIQQSPSDIESVQHHLKADEVLLEYWLSDSLLQLNAISKESTFYTIQSLDQLFWYSLRSFRLKLKAAEPRNFLIPGEILYLFLIRPVQHFLNGKQRLIIIPDERLSGIPFEAFICNDSLSQGNNICNLHYLIQDFEVVYHRSREGWDEKSTYNLTDRSMIMDEHKYAFLGFSPEFTLNKYLPALPGSQSEITEIGALFQQKGLSSSLISAGRSQKDFFKAIVCRGKIVHLATHYIRETKDHETGGFLFDSYHPAGKTRQFSGSILTMSEIKDLRLEADLVVLNACASGVDRMPDGNGSHSLPQLFLMAGARNILSTLWNVTDTLAEHFMVDFYSLWLSGKSYSAALREVKLQWISCRSTAMPTIWAPYVLTGE
ncbi:MAG: CHAT domain-containing protein [Bacteroidetes bacterium]|nr:CHAT domain-containing protein [Bacteroidota bacterium]